MVGYAVRAEACDRSDSEQARRAGLTGTEMEASYGRGEVRLGGNGQKIRQVPRSDNALESIQLHACPSFPLISD